MNSRFVWFDLVSTDMEASKDFYRHVLGWRTMDWKADGAPDDMEPYTMFCVGETPIGGIMPPPGDVPSHWMGHIQVEDVDAAMAVATEHGATFPAGAMDIPTVGRIAPMVDPEGCVVSLFRPASGEPMETLPGMTLGMVGWNEIAVADTDKATAFYQAVVGWKHRTAPMEGFDYHLFGTGEEGGDVCGMMKRPDEMPVSCWMQYFTVEDVDMTIARTKEKGGTVIAEPFDVPSVGRMAVVAGPEGAAFGIAAWDM